MDRRICDNLKGKEQNYIAPFLWLHNEDDELIINELNRIYESGIRSVCLESRTHEEFCKDDWWSDIKLIFEFCKEHNMKAWILDDKHFPTGYANDIFRDKYTDFKVYNITERHMDVVGPKKECATNLSCYLSGDDEIIAVAALRHIPDTDKYSEVIDITEGIDGEFVYYDLPEGMWRITVIIKTQKGRDAHYQPFLDMLKPEMVDLYLKEVHEAHFERLGKYFGNVFLGFFSDEPSFLNNTSSGKMFVDIAVPKACYPWCDGLLDGITDNVSEFAGLWFDIENVSERLRIDYMDRISMEYSENFTQKVGTWCRDHGIMYIGHIVEDNHIHAKTGHGPGHFFRSLKGQDMSGLDVVITQINPGFTNVAHERASSIVVNPLYYHYYHAKLASSDSHIDPFKKGRAMCEIFGAYGWSEGTKIMKYLSDHMLVRGMNYFVPHAFSPKPNDTDCPPNFYDTGNNPQFKYFKNIMEYMQRMCYLFNDGLHVPSCAVLYNAENIWMAGDFLPAEKICKELYDNLFDYDIISLDDVTRIKDGALNGEKYNVLLVPDAEFISDYQKEQLEKADIEIVIVSEDGKKVKGCPYKRIALSSLVSFMEKKGLSDVVSDYTDIYLRRYHYVRDGAHYFMFSSEDVNNEINTKLKFKDFAGGKYIEYDAFSNKAIVKESKKGEIEISLAPYNSTVIAFGDVSFDGIENYEEKNYGEKVEIAPEFTISTAELNSPDFEVYKKTTTLMSITGRGEMPEFSGQMKYEAKVKLPLKDLILDFGYVGEAMEFFLNGKSMGRRLFPPYSFEISKEDIEEENEMEIVISNHKGYFMKDTDSNSLPYEASGLLGPITIREKK